MDAWTATNYLLIQSREFAYMESTRKGYIVPRDVKAQVVDLGAEPGVIVQISGSDVPHSGFIVTRVYGVQGDGVVPLSDDVQPAGLGTIPKIASRDGMSWHQIVLAPDMETDPAPPLSFRYRHVVYLNYDPAQKKYIEEDYGSAFARQKVTTDMTYYDIVSTYYQLNDDKINLRDAPNTHAKVVQVLPRAALFEILDRTDAPDTIGGKTEPWFRILVRDSNAEGWIFGGFIKKK